MDPSWSFTKEDNLYKICPIQCVLNEIKFSVAFSSSDCDATSISLVNSLHSLLQWPKDSIVIDKSACQNTTRRRNLNLEDEMQKLWVSLRVETDEAQLKLLDIVDSNRFRTTLRIFLSMSDIIIKEISEPMNSVKEILEEEERKISKQYEQTQFNYDIFGGAGTAAAMYGPLYIVLIIMLLFYAMFYFSRLYKIEVE